MALVDVIMPQLGESIAEGTISKWHKKTGDPIAKDETLLEISTDKVDSEIPSPAAGIVEELLFPEQSTVSVLTIIARIRSGATAVASARSVALPVASTDEAVSKPENTQAHSSRGLSGADAKSAGRFYSPLVLNIARSENIRMEELDRIEGTGSSGRVSKNDVLAYIGKQHAGDTVPLPANPVPAVEPGGGEVRVVMDTMRRSIADHMVRSKQVSPHVYSVTEADVSAIAAYREHHAHGFEQREGIKLSLTPFFLDAVVRALKEFPYINASVDGHTIVLKKSIHLGVAVALEKGLIVPVIRHAEEKNIAGLARSVFDLARRARTKKLLPEEVQGGTFTVTNPGMVGNLYGIPIINQPQVAILAVGAVKKRAVVVNDAIAIRSMVYLSLSYDHRIIDGMMGGMFLERVAGLLQHFDTGSLI